MSGYVTCSATPGGMISLKERTAYHHRGPAARIRPAAAIADNRLAAAAAFGLDNLPAVLVALVAVQGAVADSAVVADAVLVLRLVAHKQHPALHPVTVSTIADRSDPDTA